MALFFLPSLGGKKKVQIRNTGSKYVSHKGEDNIYIACRLSTQTGRDWLWAKESQPMNQPLKNRNIFLIWIFAVFTLWGASCWASLNTSAWTLWRVALRCASSMLSPSIASFSWFCSGPAEYQAEPRREGQSAVQKCVCGSVCWGEGNKFWCDVWREISTGFLFSKHTCSVSKNGGQQPYVISVWADT